MALVVLLRGVNVGGHRTFKPTQLITQLKHLRAVNIGAAGTFVIHAPVGHAELRDEFAKRLPFEAEIVICDARDVAKLHRSDVFADHPEQTDIVRFVTVLAKNPRLKPPLPMAFPTDDAWQLKIVGRDKRFVFGLYRRHMKAIGYLGMLDRVFGVPVTTRNWNTIGAIAKALTSVTRSRTPPTQPHSRSPR